MTINQNREDAKLTFAIEGRIDTKTSPELENALRTSLTEDIQELVFDLAETVYISSAGLRIFLIAQKQMNRQGTMKVIHVNEDLMEIFEVTGFTDILTIA
ncbi:MAG: STAS domain-containing protein [Oscillospiraceae bacterium]|jgi:anti-sigma B factor antagonist|nr:STAS domain-containing protein [Oscillospiraceae bacterium]MBP0987962.1 STAS domain-containing protein [Oscillospiraceae bacterium]MBQ5337973.1 STAS domain-containing protein [Oscillospiraceae bacterium]MBR5364436.1 STAS domain-containing protein [Oscillospiraceae bacterium]